MPKLTPYNETAILQAVAGGDESAFREILVHYQDIIYSTAFRLTRSSAMAEDILQDTLMKVWLKRESLPELENFGGWLYRIAQNEILNALKKITIRARANHRLSAPASADYGLPSDTVELKQLETIINTAVRNLPKKQEQAYTLVKVKGMSREEASRMLGVSPETIKSNLDHAVRFIRAYCLRRLNDGFISILILFFL